MPSGATTVWPPATKWGAGVPDRLGGAVFSLLGARRIVGWDALRRDLGEPQSILCLGNGPSSESPALRDMRADRLFRVNWTWSDRGHHLSPDLVFTADHDQPPLQPTPIVCFPTRKEANRILAGYVLRGIRLPASYMVFPELACPLSMKTWSLRPTNGALMVAAATLLRPRRLIIAGIDLYLHPEGKYPGPSAEPNDYDPIHDRDLDLDFMAAALSSFEGTVDILSAQLRSALETRQRTFAGTTASSGVPRPPT